MEQHIPPLDTARPAPAPPPSAASVTITNPIPKARRELIQAGLNRLRQGYGQYLAGHGWSRGSLFLGVNPSAAESLDDLHGVAEILHLDFDVHYACKDHISFFMYGGYRVWLREGRWMGDKP
ncbi:MAG: hypothetical protein HQL53_06220 [Magnetococcales bacterium]|nr:hypothetical protein [Magnetococcales bacterium]